MTPIISNSRAIERQILQGLLCEVPEGGTVTYSALSGAVGCSIKTIWGVVASVRDDIAIDGFVFEAVRNVGLRRLTDSEIAVRVPVRRRRKIHRQARHATRELAAINDMAGLTVSDRTSALIGQSLFGALMAITTHRATKLIAENIAKTELVLPVSETIEAFRKIG